MRKAKIFIYKKHTGRLVNGERIEKSVLNRIRAGEVPEINMPHVSQMFDSVLYLMERDTVKLIQTTRADYYEIGRVSGNKPLQKPLLERVQEAILTDEVWRPFLDLFVSPLRVRGKFRRLPELHRFFLLDVAYFVIRAVHGELLFMQSTGGSW